MKHDMRLAYWTAFALGLGIALIGCGGDDETAGGTPTLAVGDRPVEDFTTGGEGGAATTGGSAGIGATAGQGEASGGTSNPAGRPSAGGTQTGGTATGGTATGGMQMGGTATGGAATGGMQMGGTATGGAATGGTQMGGTATGGAQIGGAATGGMQAGGAAGESGCDVAGWYLEQANSTIVYDIPVGTPRLPPGGYLIVARDAGQPEFETFWSVALASNVVFINSAGSFPSINGSESYTLRNATTIVDGPTIALQSAAGQSIQRLSPLGAASETASWSVQNSGTDTSSPGTSGLDGKATGSVVISEFSDALGTGNYIYEFVELFCAM